MQKPYVSIQTIIHVFGIVFCIDIFPLLKLCIKLCLPLFLFLWPIKTNTISLLAHADLISFQFHSFTLLQPPWLFFICPFHLPSSFPPMGGVYTDCSSYLRGQIVSYIVFLYRPIVLSLSYSCPVVLSPSKFRCQPRTQMSPQRG